MNVIVDIVGRENVPCWRGVTADGFIADSADATHISKIVGVSAQGAGYNWVVPVMLCGELSAPSWNWVTGWPIYVNGKYLSQTPPLGGFQQIMGCAKDTLTMVVQKGMTFLSSMSKMWDTAGFWRDVTVEGTDLTRQMIIGDPSTDVNGPFITKFRNTTTGLWPSVYIDAGQFTMSVAESPLAGTGDMLNTTTNAWVPVTIEGTGLMRQFVLGTE